MGIQHKGKIYLDLCPSFGARSSSASQQRVSRAVCYMLEKDGHDVVAYVDDFCGAHATFREAMAAFVAFESLCEDLGLKVAPEKSKFPTTKLEWLGFDIDTVEMKITIPDQKLADIITMADTWMEKRTISRRDLQSIAGKLNHGQDPAGPESMPTIRPHEYPGWRKSGPQMVPMLCNRVQWHLHDRGATLCH